MSYEARKEETKRQARYDRLAEHVTRIQNQTQSWVDEATALHNETTDPIEQAEIIAMRDAFVLALRTTLGV